MENCRFILPTKINERKKIKALSRSSIPHTEMRKLILLQQEVCQFPQILEMKIENYNVDKAEKHIKRKLVEKWKQEQKIMKTIILKTKQLE